ncbi:MAG: DNA polymerase III subunit gamma/tau [Rhodospirillales bacterium]|nr:DNA polymerase III subunit gamma/tau [Rhodospirillales bacterium]
MSGLFDDPPPPAGPGLFAEAPPGPTPGLARPETAGATAYRVLARKYRPIRLADLIGQAAMVRTLTNAFATRRVAHAFMLTGVRGVGKTSTARIIARALNCTGPDGTGGPTAEPCGACPNCVAILAERHPDVLEMDAASRTGVDDVREIIEATRFRPLQARKKVFIIDEVHMLSRNAFNALLKTLEEPPSHVAFVFATTEVRKVPLTVLSRCQRFDLRRLGVAELAAHFGRIATAEAVAIAPEALAVIARAADGSVRDGLSLLDQVIAREAGDGPIGAEAVAAMLGMAEREAVFDLLEALLAGRPAAALAIADAAHARGTDAGLLLADLLELLHNLSRLKAIPALKDDPDLPEAERTRGAALAERVSVPVLARAWQMALKGVQEVESAPDRRAAADMVLIRLCYVADLPPPGELVRTIMAERAAPTHSKPDSPASPSRRSVPQAGPALAATASAPERAPLPASFRAVVGRVAEAREALLAAQLLHHVHLVRFAPPVIEIAPDATAPRDLAARLGQVLQAATGVRWTIALAAAPGEPTLAEQDRAAEQARRAAATRHPLVSAILEAFPGAEIAAVHEIEAEPPESEPAEPAEPPSDSEEEG